MLPIQQQQVQQRFPGRHHQFDKVVINHRQMMQQTLAIFMFVLPQLLDLLASKSEAGYKSVLIMNPFDNHPLLMTISIVGLLLFSFLSYIQIPPAFTMTTRVFQIVHVILRTLVIAMLALFLIPQYYPLICALLMITYMLILCTFPFFGWFLEMFKSFSGWLICCIIPDMRLIPSHSSGADEAPAATPNITVLLPAIPVVSTPTAAAPFHSSGAEEAPAAIPKIKVLLPAVPVAFTPTAAVLQPKMKVPAPADEAPAATPKMKVLQPALPVASTPTAEEKEEDSLC